LQGKYKKSNNWCVSFTLCFDEIQGKSWLKLVTYAFCVSVYLMICLRFLFSFYFHFRWMVSKLCFIDSQSSLYITFSGLDFYTWKLCVIFPACSSVSRSISSTFGMASSTLCLLSRPVAHSHGSWPKVCVNFFLIL
jgi:hypothetical protein